MGETLLSQEEFEQFRSVGPETGRWTFRESVPSAVTTGWGVSWNEELTARDLMQNFRDANKSSLDLVRTVTKHKSVAIFGPAEFNLKRLYFLGSEKSADAGDIGAYGEGFKAACLALLRDFGAIPLVVSGGSAVHVRVGEEVSGTDLRPLVYDYYDVEKRVEGTWLLVLGCTSVLQAELLRSMEHFFWEQHPALGELLHTTKRLSIYRSTTSDGLGFYRGLRRLVMPKVPFVFVLDGVDRSLESKTKQDRDRKAFAEAVAGAFYKAVAKDLPTDLIRKLLIGTKPLWPSGHPLLSELAAAAPGWYGATLEERMKSVQGLYGDLFEPGVYCAKQQPREWNQEIARLDMEMRQQGRVALPHYFIYFGVESAGVVHEIQEDRHLESIRTAENTTPTEAEQACIKLLNSAIGALEGGEIAAVLSGRGFRYMVAHTNEVLGMLRSNRGYGSSEVVLAHDLFEMRFSTALSTLLHEYAHVFGGDGSRRFTDALTHIIERVVEKRDLIDPYETQWRAAVSAVRAERTGPSDVLRTRLMDAPLEEIRGLIEKASQDVLVALERGSLPSPGQSMKVVGRSTDGEASGGGVVTLEGSLRQLVKEHLLDLVAAEEEGVLAFDENGRLVIGDDRSAVEGLRGTSEDVRYVELSDNTTDVVRMSPDAAGGLTSSTGFQYELDASTNMPRIKVGGYGSRFGLKVARAWPAGIPSAVAALIIERILAEIQLFVPSAEGHGFLLEVVGLRYVEPGRFVALTVEGGKHE